MATDNPMDTGNSPLRERILRELTEKVRARVRELARTVRPRLSYAIVGETRIEKGKTRRWS